MKKLITLVSIISAMLSSAAFAKDIELSLLTSTNPSEAGYQSLLDQIKIFEELYPKASIKVTTVGHDNYFTKLQALTLADQLPDLMHLWPSKRTSFVTSSGKVMDLMPLVKRDGLEDKVLPIVLKPQSENGEVFVLPNNINITNIVYTNAEILDELNLQFPKTFNDWYEQAEVIREAGYFPLVFGNASSWVGQSCLLSPIAGKTAGDAWFDQALKGEVLFTEEPFVQALQTIADMRDHGLASKAMNSLSREKAVEFFTLGKAAYYIEGAWSIAEFTKTMTDEELKRTHLNVLPELNNVSGSTSAVGGTSYGINANLKDSEKLEYAWQWVKLFNGFGDQRGVDIAIDGGIIPPLKQINMPEDAPILIKRLAELQSDLNITYVLDAILNPTGMEYMNTALQEIIADQSTAEQVAEKYQKVAFD